MFSDFNDEEIDIYEKIGQKLKIRQEIQKINEKIEIFKVKEEIEQVSLESDITALLDRKKLLDEEESDISDSTEYKSIVGTLDSLKSLKVKLQRLEGKKGTISEKIFEKLKLEYEDDYKKSELLLLKETERIQKLHQKLENFIKNIGALREEERLRFDLQEYSEEQYDKILDTISKNEKRAESVLYATSVLLDEFKSDLQ